MAEIRNNLVLDNEFILKMLKNPLWLRNFPFLLTHASVIKNQKASCGTCNSSSAPKVDFGAIKKTVALLPSSQRDLFKRTAKALNVEVHFKNSKNQAEKVTF